MNEISFKIIRHNSPEYHNSIILRDLVLRKPLGLKYDLEYLDKERDYILIAGFKDNKVIATAILVPKGTEYKMQQVAVDPQLQGTGVGSKILDFCDEYAKEQGFKSIYCHARINAVPFYQKNQYSVEGDYFEEVGIQHLLMRKSLVE